MADFVLFGRDWGFSLKDIRVPVRFWHGDADGIGPLTRVGGLSLFMRTILTLQRAQFTSVIVLSGDELAAVGRSLRDDPRLTLSLRWLPVREFPPEDPKTW